MQRGGGDGPASNLIIALEYFNSERNMKCTVDTDIQFTEVHNINDGKLHDDVSGWWYGSSALQADRSTSSHGARVLATHGVGSYHWRLYVCGYVRQTDDEIVRSVR